jgi:ribosomal protein L37AE/L43A
MATMNEETLQIELTAEDKEALQITEEEEANVHCEFCLDTKKIENEDGFIYKCKLCDDSGEGYNSQDKE